MPKALHSRFEPFAVLDWVDPDSKKNFKDHWADRDTRKQLIENGYTPDTAIVYELDGWALRNKPGTSVHGSLLALGCSHTFGVGLDTQDIWPTLLAKKLSMPVFNGGMPGGSADTAFRILNTLLDGNRPEAVFCLVPYNDRWEFILDDQYEMFGPWEFGSEITNRLVNKIHINEERNSLNELKNILAMTKLCDQKGIPFIHMGLVTDPIKFKNDWARDLAHQGKRWHKAITERFQELYHQKTHRGI